MARQPEGPPPPPTVQRLRIRYAKRGPLRFTSHRDVARALERAVRRAAVPVAFSAGFSPHPKLSYLGAAPTGVASEAEYAEIGLASACDPVAVAKALDASLPPGLDVIECLEAGPGSLADRIQASEWQVTLRGVDVDTTTKAVEAFMAQDEVEVERRTKDGRRLLDARGAVVSLDVFDPTEAGGTDDIGRIGGAGDRVGAPCAILRLVVRHLTPAVRPDDVLTGLRLVARSEPPAPPEATRLAQGPLGEDGKVGDPLAPDRPATAGAGEA